jgi:hypothetical protein
MQMLAPAWISLCALAPGGIAAPHGWEKPQSLTTKGPPDVTSTRDLCSFSSILETEYDTCGNLSRLRADPGAPCRFMSAGFMKRFSLFLIVESEGSAVKHLVYFRTDRMAYLLLKPKVHFTTDFLGFSKLFCIFNGLSTDDLGNSHNTPNYGAAGLPSSGYPTGQAGCHLECPNIL